MQTFTDVNLQVRMFHNFITYENDVNLYHYIINNAKFKHGHYTPNGNISKRRNKCIYGCIPSYKATFRDVEYEERIISWDELPYLKEMAKVLSSFTGQEYHVYVIQMYNNGDVGIKPHRDKEMKYGTIITSLSLGSTRVMRFERFEKVIDIPFPHCSLCLIDPPTNDFWLHSIPIDSTISPRISLIFRNCEGM
jgi:hypothetical protein